MDTNAQACTHLNLTGCTSSGSLQPGKSCWPGLALPYLNAPAAVVATLTQQRHNPSAEASTPAGQPTEVLAGSIERVTFHKPGNGFCVLRIKARGHRDLVTVVGHAV